MRLAAVRFPAVRTGLRALRGRLAGFLRGRPSVLPRLLAACAELQVPDRGLRGGTSPSHEGLTQRRGPSPVRL